MLVSEFSWRVAFLTAISLAAPMSALANHGVPTDRLVVDAGALLDQVRYAGLRYEVVASVERLNYESRELDRCVDVNGGGRTNAAEPLHERGPGRGHPGHPGHGPYPGPTYPGPTYPAPTYPQPGSRYCSYELSGVQTAFREVESYLYDTQYDRPHVYRLFVQVRQDVDSVASALLNPGTPSYPYPGNPYPGQPYPGTLRAVGAIDTLSFNFIGDRFQIERQCLDLAARVNARWIQTVTVNGRRYQEPYGRWMGIQEACGIVARQAQ